MSPKYFLSMNSSYVSSDNCTTRSTSTSTYCLRSIRILNDEFGLITSTNLPSISAGFPTETLTNIEISCCHLPSDARNIARPGYATSTGLSYSNLNNNLKEPSEPLARYCSLMCFNKNLSLILISVGTLTANSFLKYLMKESSVVSISRISVRSIS